MPDDEAYDRRAFEDRPGERATDGHGGRPDYRDEAPAQGNRQPEPDRDVDPTRDEPDVPADIDPAELDHEIRAELRSLAKPVADAVARRLVASGRLIDVDPPAALAHAMAARRLAPRLAPVREAVGLTAYKAGAWSTAVAELRAYHRITGRQTHLAVIADSERAMGRPERAIDLYRSADAAKLDPASAAELLIVAAGARADLGQHDAALAMLQVPELTAEPAVPWATRLRYAYADMLLAVGRRDDAREWFARAAEADDDLTTDAAERLLDLDGVVLADDQLDEDESDEDDVDEEGRVEDEPDEDLTQEEFDQDDLDEDLKKEEFDRDDLVEDHLGDEQLRDETSQVEAKADADGTAIMPGSGPTDGADAGHAETDRKEAGLP